MQLNLLVTFCSIFLNHRFRFWKAHVRESSDKKNKKTEFVSGRKTVKERLKWIFAFFFVFLSFLNIVTCSRLAGCPFLLSY